MTRRAPLLTPPDDAVWSALLTPVVVGNVVGCTDDTNASQFCAHADTLTDNIFEYGDVNYRILDLNTYAGGPNIGRLEFFVNTFLPVGTVDLILVVDGVEYPFIGADGENNAGRWWDDTGLDQTWSAGVPVAVWLVEPPSTDATLSALTVNDGTDDLHPDPGLRTGHGCLGGGCGPRCGTR